MYAVTIYDKKVFSWISPTITTTVAILPTTFFRSFKNSFAGPKNQSKLANQQAHKFPLTKLARKLASIKLQDLPNQ